jgi:hypothetical protein
MTGLLLALALVAWAYTARYLGAPLFAVALYLRRTR